MGKFTLANLYEYVDCREYLYFTLGLVFHKHPLVAKTLIFKI